MIDETVVNLSRLQFGLTAMYHFLFVPLTLGLAFLLAIMESVYVMTGRVIYRDMTKFWGKLFGINFAMGVATGVTLEFQFGTNWAYYSHYVGDIFGAPLAIEGLMAFFLESTLVGLFFFGWNRLSKVQHLAVTWLLAIGSSLSALWILIANAWMQFPIGAEFNPITMRMELTSFADLFFNPVAQVKFVHTVAAGYVTGAMFVLGISSWYLLKRRDAGFALRSFAVASGFGLASVLSVIVLGDESGYTMGGVQKVKLAAIEAEWETQEPPADFTLFAIPNQEKRRNDYEIKIPWVMGLIATRSTTEKVEGIDQIIERHKDYIRSGIIGYESLQEIKAGYQDARTEELFYNHAANLGYALLLKRYTEDISSASEELIHRAALDSIPQVAPLFWTFRVMIGAGVLMLFIFMAAFWYMAREQIPQKRWLLWLALLGMPLPWIASECGWFVAEYGRQPWTIAEVLPTFLSASAVPVSSVIGSLVSLGLLYTAMLVVEVWLMLKYVRLGPSTLKTGRYHFERAASANPVGANP